VFQLQKYKHQDTDQH